jgi:hypothetical protein
MSYYHKRSISGATAGNTINPIIKVSRPGVVSLNKQSLSPYKHIIKQKNESRDETSTNDTNKANKSKDKNITTQTKFEMNRTGFMKSLANNKKITNSRPITANYFTNSLMKSTRDKKESTSNHSFEDDKIKVNRNGSKSPGSRPDSERVSVMRGTVTGFNKPTTNNNIVIKKESLFKKFEDIKSSGVNHRSVSPILLSGSSNNDKLINKKISIKEENINISTKTNLRMQPRGTVAFNGPEEMHRENKFKNLPDFREMNTSPLLIRVYNFLI